MVFLSLRCSQMLWVPAACPYRNISSEAMPTLFRTNTNGPLVHCPSCLATHTPHTCSQQSGFWRIHPLFLSSTSFFPHLSFFFFLVFSLPLLCVSISRGCSWDEGSVWCLVCCRWLCVFPVAWKKEDRAPRGAFWVTGGGGWQGDCLFPRDPLLECPW